MKNDHLFERFGTHLPILLFGTSLSHNPILELGSGFWSTLTLHYGCPGRRIVTMDDNKDWLSTFTHLANERHAFIHVSHWDKNTEIIDKTQWGLVFVDHGPNERRQTEVARVCHNADVVVVHDTENLILHHYDFSMYKHVFEWKDCSHCHTGIMSNFIDVGQMLKSV